MKWFLMVSSILFSLNLSAASRYWVGGGSSANWSATGPTNWSTTSGGANNASVPGSGDDVIFDGSGNSNATVSASITVLSFTVASGYTSTITHNATLTVAGNVTLTTGYTISGAGQLTISANSTMTSGGQTWPNNLSLSGSSTTKTLADNWIIGGALLFSTSSVVLNWTTSETISCAGLTMSTAPAVGSAKIILTGGTWSSANAVVNDLDIVGNVTISGSVAFHTKTLTYVSGTVTTTGSTLFIGSSVTLNTAGITWNNVNITAGATLTLNSLLSVAGTLAHTANAAFVYAGSSGFTAHTVTHSTTSSSGSLTLNDGVTYAVTNALTMSLSRTGSSLLITSDHASNRANLVLSHGATCSLLANLTRIDASGGRTIRTFNGTVTDCINVVVFNDLTTIKN